MQPESCGAQGGSCTHMSQDWGKKLGCSLCIYIVTIGLWVLYMKKNHTHIKMLFYLNVKKIITNRFLKKLLFCSHWNVCLFGVFFLINYESNFVVETRFYTRGHIVYICCWVLASVGSKRVPNFLQWHHYIKTKGALSGRVLSWQMG